MPAAPLLEILTFLDGLLEPERYEDYGPNGLQVPGRDQVELIVTGVSANRALIHQAAELDAGLLLVHHGLFWRGAPLEITKLQAGRLRPLLANDINLVAYHLPLDAHPTVGNNALIADALGLEERRPFARHAGQPIGVHGELPGDGLTIEELAARLAELCQPPLRFPGGPERIRTLGIVTGGGADSIHEAAALGLDAFISGEPEERTQGAADEEGISFFGAGHHASERFGVRRLGELVTEHFGIAHRFIDIDNPV